MEHITAILTKTLEIDPDKRCDMKTVLNEFQEIDKILTKYNCESFIGSYKEHLSKPGPVYREVSAEEKTEHEERIKEYTNIQENENP
jgi:hypothetical protein